MEEQGQEGEEQRQEEEEQGQEKGSRGRMSSGSVYGITDTKY